MKGLDWLVVGSGFQTKVILLMVIDYDTVKDDTAGALLPPLPSSYLHKPTVYARIHARAFIGTGPAFINLHGRAPSLLMT